MHIGGYVEAHLQDSLCKAGTQEVPGEVVTGDSGGTKGGKAAEDGDSGQSHGEAPDR